MPSLKRNLARVVRGSIERFQVFAIKSGSEEPKPRVSVLPYLSGDAFLSIADICVLSGVTAPLVLRPYNKPQILFCEVGLVEKAEKEGLLQACSVVIIHNGDAAPSESEIETLKKYSCRLYATNLNLVDVFFQPIPIGIENAHHRRNGSIHYYNPLNLAQVDFTKSEEVLVSFSVVTNLAERTRILKVCENYGFSNEMMKLDEFRKRLAATKFVISPPGNGIDCHRTWEAMYHQAVPVIEKKYHLFQHLDLPILAVDSYEDFFMLSPEARDKIYIELMLSEQSYPALYMDYWISQIYAPEGTKREIL